ncbi:taurine catabolism dioxygenase [Gonapodya prolifera JEL478]|uniref:Taurine catabolism dioxygenase n=1 Tax=Gonapodya prolifera (strain JEL478) TaxID=1344416 RepID=A0A139B0C4_GONPJ|nr:taurine catabolism dioxygenase [Gonapodya prolifera JEL478]|eukprot:KXS22424.1 taurine catabolism dioxygenase [Gonapodya prolifera JEL478]
MSVQPFNLTEIGSLASQIGASAPACKDIPSSSSSALRVAPKAYSGSLDKYASFKVTPNIGLEFSNLPLASLTDQQIEDLSILISQHNVVVIRGAHLTPQQLLDIGRKIATPKGTLHIHPITAEIPGRSELDELTVVSNEIVYGGENAPASDGWHSDISFEPNPSSYAALQIVQGPDAGGDTQFSSGYAAYDRLSKPLQRFLETLNGENDGNAFHEVANKSNIKIREKRGAANVGTDLRSVHPLVRTNPVTGWKSLYVSKAFTKRIVELPKSESDLLLNFLFNHIAQGFDFSTRVKWNPGDIAFWDNRSTYHAATKDFDESILRRGIRVVPLGERPYLDPASVSKSEAVKAVKDAKL